MEQARLSLFFLSMGPQERKLIEQSGSFMTLHDGCGTKLVLLPQLHVRRPNSTRLKADIMALCIERIIESNEAYRGLQELRVGVVCSEASEATVVGKYLCRHTSVCVVTPSGYLRQRVVQYGLPVPVPVPVLETA